MYYQPQYYLYNHKFRGFEALIRWNDKKGWHQPAEFIPEIENTNAMHILGEWILEKAMAMLSEWQQKYNFNGVLSVNVSPVQLNSPFFLSQMEKLLEKYKIQKNTFELEITEGIFIFDIKKISELLKNLQQLGLKIALDDFGTGYSSLRYLGNMPINTVKFDKSFIDDLQNTEGFAIDILASLLPVIKKAGIETIAEGVENPVQLCMLMDINCTCIQGFLWGQPESSDMCERLF